MAGLSLAFGMPDVKCDRDKTSSSGAQKDPPTKDRDLYGKQILTNNLPNGNADF
jgi:hypothetical protein